MFISPIRWNANFYFIYKYYIISIRSPHRWSTCCHSTIDLYICGYQFGHVNRPPWSITMILIKPIFVMTDGLSIKSIVLSNLRKDSVYLNVSWCAFGLCALTNCSPFGLFKSNNAPLSVMVTVVSNGKTQLPFSMQLSLDCNVWCLVVCFFRCCHLHVSFTLSVVGWLDLSSNMSSCVGHRVRADVPPLCPSLPLA